MPIRSPPAMSEVGKDNTDMSSKLYDRDDQISALSDAYQRRCVEPSRQREIVIITGPSGAGKTALALQLKESVDQDEGFFISGKFDQLAATYQATSKSYEPFEVACTDLCHQVVAKGVDRVSLVKAAIRQSLSAVELSVLQGSIPALQLILGSPQILARRSSSVSLSRGVDAEGRFVRILCRFLLSVCAGYQSPLIIFLDDLQWANNKALELLKALAVAEKSMAGSKLMILCTYRDDEISPQDHLSVCLDEIKEDGVIIKNIAVLSMSEMAVHDMIAEVLDLPNEQCLSLARIIYHKTGGNVFFIKQLLRYLCEERLLISRETGQLRWDDSQILEATANQSVLELLSKKVEQLPDKAKEVLKVASCLGLAFEESVLWAAGTANKTEVTSALCLAEERGLVIVSSDFGNARFVHDKVQQAAYSLIPEQERAEFHLNIGRKIFPIVPPKADDAHLLLLADQIARGLHLVKDSDEKLVFAELYLRAGEKAAMASAYSNSAAFLAIGVKLIGEEGWTKKYSLALTLYNTATEVECYNGNFARVDALVATVFKRAHKFEDTLKAHFTRIYSLGSRNDMQCCVTEALKLLEVLGQKFPNKVTNFHVATAFMRCRGKLRGKSDEDILRLPIMEDTMKQTAIQLIILIAFWANSVRKQLAPLLSARVIVLTMRHGMNDMCCASFATLSFMLAIRGDYDHAYRYGNLALQIFDAHEAEEWHARVGGSVYGGIYPMKHPYRLSLQPLLAAQRSGLVLGDIHFSMVCSFFYSGIAFCSGVRLSQLVKETTAFRDLSIRYRLKTAITIANIILQLFHNFSGKATDPLVLTGEALDEKETLLETNGKHPVAYMCLLIYKHQLAVYMNDFSEAQRISAVIQRGDMGNIFPFLVSSHVFMEGLVVSRLSQTSKQQWTRANRMLSKLRRYAKHCPQNFQGKVYLVEAELAASTGDVDGALVKYKESIERACSQGHIHEEALAYERAGYALRYCGRMEEARDFLDQAKSRYASWGARAKVNQLGSIA